MSEPMVGVGDTFERDGETWRIVELMPHDGGSLAMLVRVSP